MKQLLGFTLVFFFFLATVFGQSQELIRQWQTEGWTKTNFQKTQAPLEEIISGGPPRDGIPPIYTPHFESITQASAWLPDSEPVLVYSQSKVPRAYPLRILIWHEIVNDQEEGKSFIVTYCPLCNSGVIYNTRLQGKNSVFGVSGKLRHSDMIMWDHTTESWWQQLTGEAIVGDAVGASLEMLPSPMIAFGTFKSSYPAGQVLSQKTGFKRVYGGNPYEGYDRAATPFLMRETVDSRLVPLSRVLGMEWQGKFYTLPLAAMQGKSWAKAVVEGQELILLNLSVANSALDQATIAESRLFDHVTIWANPSRSEPLSFFRDEAALRDKKHQYRWDALGQGWQGTQLKARLTPVRYGIHFAFAWLAFHPDSVFLQLQP